MPRFPTIAILSLASCLCAQLWAAPGTLVRDSIVDPLAHNFPTVTFGVPTVHGVTFQQDGVTTYQGWQYAAYYQGNLANSVGKVSVGRRRLPDGAWQTLVLNDYNFTKVDSHNDVVLGICAQDGTIHLSFDHHGDPLHYRVSEVGLANNPTTTAWEPSRFGPTLDRLLPGGTTMTAVTYPRFIPTPEGKLLFTYRFGGSGGGDEFLYEYQGATHAWSLVGQYTTRSGSYTGTFGTSTDRNSYFDNTLFDRNGRLHASWCWRETPDAGSNHDLLYAYSDDVGRTWKNQLGATIAVAGSSYINVNSPGIIGWPIPQRRNYINNSAMTVDGDGRVHVVSWQLPDAFPDQSFNINLTSNSRFIHYWRGTDGTWRKNETNLTGSRAKLSADDDGRLFLIYGNATNLQIAAANSSANPETSPANSWNDWATLTLSGALPAGEANTVNIINDTSRWEADRIISVYAQETNISGTGPTPLHVLDYHVSRAAVLPAPENQSSIPGFSPVLEWTAGQGAVQHDVYFGTQQTAVTEAALASPEYLGRQTGVNRSMPPLLPHTTYYWRVDSADASDTITKGRVWSFTTTDLVPAVSQGSATRTYGGRATFQITLDLKDPALTDGELSIYYGSVDGGTNPSGWQGSSQLGSQVGGTTTVTVDGIPAGNIHYRFHLSTIHGSSWSSNTSVLSGDGDLATWAHSALLEVSGYTGAGPLADFPVLVRLSPANVPGFNHADLLSPPFGDLRFSTASGAILAHEVETWNPAGTSHVWVKIPQLANGTAIRVWWGKAGQSAVTSAATWSAFNGVWHLDGALGSATDSSSNNTVGASTAVTSAASGVIPGAALLNGTSSNIAINNSAALNPSLLSVEAWVKTSSNSLHAIFNKDRSAGGRVWQFRINAGKPELIVFNTSLITGAAASPTAVHDNQFHHVCGTWDGVTVRMYVDGTLKASTPFSGSLATNQSNQAFIGRGENADPAFLNGTIDEVRLSPVARSADWVSATWENQKSGSTFLSGTPFALADLDDDHLPDSWEMAHFESTFTTVPDPDGDGFSNLAEFALGTDPDSGSNAPETILLSSNAAAEFVYPQISGGSGEIGTTYTADGIRYTVEISGGLGFWQSGPGIVMWSGRREALPAGMERVGIRITDPTLASLPAVFARLRLVGID